MLRPRLSDQPPDARPQRQSVLPTHRIAVRCVPLHQAKTHLTERALHRVPRLPDDALRLESARRLSQVGISIGGLGLAKAGRVEEGFA